MATIDIVTPSYKGYADEARSALVSMVQATNCACRDEHGRAIHDPWKCPRGRHSLRIMPPIKASSVVHWARNQSVAQALYGQPKDGRPLADRLFLMDDDMLCQPYHLTRLASYNADIVCGICTIRRDPPIPNIRFWKPETATFVYPEEWDWDSNKLMEIDAAGAAFMLVKRQVFEKMAETYLACERELEEDARKMSAPPVDLADYWKRKSEARRERFRKATEEGNWQKRDCWWFQFLDNVVDDQVGELGEDLGFCWKAKELGFKIYADPQVLPGHLGMYGYSILDYRDHVEQSKAEFGARDLQENHVALGV